MKAYPSWRGNKNVQGSQCTQEASFGLLLVLFWVSLGNQRGTSGPINWEFCKETDRHEITLLQMTSSLMKRKLLSWRKNTKNIAIYRAKGKLMQQKKGGGGRSCQGWKKVRKKKRKTRKTRMRRRKMKMMMNELVLAQFLFFLLIKRLTPVHTP